MKIFWTDRITNEEVLQRIGETRLLIGTIVKRKKVWTGHALRENGMLKEIIEVEWKEKEKEAERGRHGDLLLKGKVMQ